MKLPEGTAEPSIARWQRVSTQELVDRLGLPDRTTGNRVILVDGRSAGGKTTLARRFQEALPGAAIVHTDDVAWNHSFFDWDTQLIDNVLAPVRRNEPVRYRPPGWVANGRDGAIVVEAERDVIVEGVGAGRASIAAWADAVVWVQSDFDEARVRGIARDREFGARPADEVESFWDEWMRSELPFLEAEQPWQSATVIVAGHAAGGDIDLALT